MKANKKLSLKSLIYLMTIVSTLSIASSFVSAEESGVVASNNEIVRDGENSGKPEDDIYKGENITDSTYNADSIFPFRVNWRGVPYNGNDEIAYRIRINSEGGYGVANDAGFYEIGVKALYSAFYNGIELYSDSSAIVRNKFISTKGMKTFRTKEEMEKSLDSIKEGATFMAPVTIRIQAKDIEGNILDENEAKPIEFTTWRVIRKITVNDTKYYQIMLYSPINGNGIYPTPGLIGNDYFAGNAGNETENLYPGYNINTESKTYWLDKNGNISYKGILDKEEVDDFDKNSYEKNSLTIQENYKEIMAKLKKYFGMEFFGSTSENKASYKANLDKRGMIVKTLRNKMVAGIGIDTAGIFFNDLYTKEQMLDISSPKITVEFRAKKVEDKSKIELNNEKDLSFSKDKIIDSLKANVKSVKTFDDKDAEYIEKFKEGDNYTTADYKLDPDNVGKYTIVFKDENDKVVEVADLKDNGKYKAVYTLRLASLNNPADTFAHDKEKVVEFTVKPSDSGTNPGGGEADKDKDKDKDKDPDRISGKDRIDTSIDNSRRFYNSDRVIIVRNDLFPDSMTASVLAKILNAPIILNPTDRLDPRVDKELERLNAKEIIIVGGVDSISESVRKDLNKYDSSIERISGKDRYETSVAVGMRIKGLVKNTNTAVIASGELFPDALVIGPYAAREEYPILLVRKYDAPKSVQDGFKSMDVKNSYIVGGYNTISKQLETEVPSILDRLAGLNRYETAMEIAKKKFPTSSEVFFTTGKTFSDSLVAGSVAGRLNNPILLIDDEEKVKVKEFVSKQGYKRYYVVGGERSVSPDLVKFITEGLKIDRVNR